ncbi:hypothetical protein BDZ97DRAFT_1922021 [Flammula alnicola]|nr:hypothetical protein BDZ97DRAFT_1922021 [Flammula alnicola]
MDAFEAEGANYLGAVLITAFYGFHVALFSFFIGIYRRHKKNPFAGALNLAVIAQFILGTATAAVLVAVTYISLVTSDFEPHSKASLTYRCFIIWDQSYTVMMLPVLLTLATLCTGLAQVGLLQNRHPTMEVINTTLNITTANFALSMAVNGITTIIIIARIWLASRRIKKLSNDSVSDSAYNVVMAILFDSGLTIFLAQLCALVLYRTQSAGYNVITGVVAQIYAFTPTIILIRVATGSSYESDTKMSQSIAFAPTPGQLEAEKPTTLSTGWGADRETQTVFNAENSSADDSGEEQV